MPQRSKDLRETQNDETTFGRQLPCPGRGQKMNAAQSRPQPAESRGRRFRRAQATFERDRRDDIATSLSTASVMYGGALCATVFVNVTGRTGSRF